MHIGSDEPCAPMAEAQSTNSAMRNDPAQSRLLDSPVTLDPTKITFTHFEDSGVAKAIVTIYRILDFKEKQQFVEKIRSAASGENRKWIINLVEMGFCDSLMMGFCVMIYHIVKHLGGSTEFVMRRDSFLHHKFEQAHLMQIFSVEFV